MAPAGGQKVAAGCSEVRLKSCFRPVEVGGWTSNSRRLVSCFIVPVVLNKQL